MKQDRPCMDFEWLLPVGILVSMLSSSFEFSWLLIGTYGYLAFLVDLLRICGYIQVSAVDRWVHADVSV